LEDINLQEKSQLKLVETKTFKSGSVALHYLKQERKTCDRSDTLYNEPSGQ
jgi:hypothetical protein